jgi:hypothetical protein
VDILFLHQNGNNGDMKRKLSNYYLIKNKN